MERNTHAMAIVRSVLALGQSLGIPVLAEGVETAAQLQILRIEGCHEAQGYYLGRPGPRENILPTSAERQAIVNLGDGSGYLDRMRTVIPRRKPRPWPGFHRSIRPSA